MILYIYTCDDTYQKMTGTLYQYSCVYHKLLFICTRNTCFLYTVQLNMYYHAIRMKNSMHIISYDTCMGYTPYEYGRSAVR